MAISVQLDSSSLRNSHAAKEALRVGWEDMSYKEKLVIKLEKGKYQKD